LANQVPIPTTLLSTTACCGAFITLTSLAFKTFPSSVTLKSWPTKSPNGTSATHLVPLRTRALQLISHFKSVTIAWCRRQFNAMLADCLANLATPFRSSHWCPQTARGRPPCFTGIATVTTPWAHLCTYPATPANGPLPPIFHSPTQVVTFLDHSLQDSRSTTPSAFRQLLADTFFRASLSPSDLHHTRLTAVTTTASTHERPTASST